MSTYVFPGQGSQSKGMGGGLFDEFADLTAQADAILGYSIKDLCLEDPNSNLGQTQYTQPALYIVNAFSYLKRIAEVGKKPDFVAGHSLGEYNALFAAGAFDFATGLRLVKKRGQLMSLAVGGGMAAVIGLNDEQIAAILKQHNLQNIDIANYNSPQQIVISGLKADIDLARSVFENDKNVKMYIPLKTSGAFHSHYMEEAQKEFTAFINNYQFHSLEIPVISNVHARPYQQGDSKQNLIDQITHPVKWTDSIRYLLSQGETDFEEIGAGKVLTGLIQRIKREAGPLVKTEPVQSAARPAQIFLASSLGSSDFKKDYHVKYAYVTGGMYRGVASPEMVVKIGRSGMLGFLGTGGLDLPRIETAIKYIQTELSAGQAYGVNLLHNPTNLDKEEKTVDLLLESGVKIIEAAAFLSITPALVRYRAKNLTRDRQGNVIAEHKMIAKISRPEVAKAFFSPAPEQFVAQLVLEHKITQAEADLLKEIPMADDVCVEADSGGHTDGGVAYALTPAIIQLRDEIMKKYRYAKVPRVGAAGGIGTPEAAAAAFILGADFIVTGSINQCTVEAGTSDAVKDLLQQMNVQDTEYAPAGDMFELGAKVQVLKKGLFFSARANKLFEIYRQYNSLEEIDEKTKLQIQEKYFKKTFEEVYKDVKSFYPPQEITKAERNPKHKMALIFRWYFGYSSRLALQGSTESKVDYQIHCGPALGAFNQWVKGTSLENWKGRHVDEIAIKLMSETANLLSRRYDSFLSA